MANNTKIEWTNATWNVLSGCSRVSSGCVNCYAERFAHRFSGKGQRYEGLTQITNGHPAWTGNIMFSENALLKPIYWRKPRRIFVNSMSDLFHENVTDEQIDKIFAVMALCQKHTFQILTKRPERMLSYMNMVIEEKDMQRWQNAASDFPIEYKDGDSADCVIANSEFPLPNVWPGTSVENQKYADERIPLLLQTPAAVRFLSCEPLLESITLAPLADKVYKLLSNWYNKDGFDPSGSQPTITRRKGYFPKIDWVIVGGESGPGARPFNLDWAKALVDECAAAKCACFVKQLGAHVIQDGTRHIKRDKKGGDPSEWPHEIRVRQFPETK